MLYINFDTHLLHFLINHVEVVRQILEKVVV